MTTITTRTFRSGNSEAVRLPKEIAFGEGVELDVTRTGNVVVLRPREERWDAGRLIEKLATLRRPSYVQEREPFDFPDRG